MTVTAMMIAVVSYIACVSITYCPARLHGSCAVGAVAWPGEAVAAIAPP